MKTRPPKSLSDADILTELQAAVTEGRLHPANLTASNKRANLRDRVGKAAFTLLSWLARRLPQSLSYPLAGRATQLLGWLTFPIRPKLTERLRYAFPNASNREIARIRAKFWYNLGQTSLEFLDFERFQVRMQSTTKIVGGEHVERALASGKPLVIIHCHLSNWEAPVPALIWLTHRPVSAIYAPPSIAALHLRVLRQRLKAGLIPFPRGMHGPMRALKTQMSKGTPILITLDQRVRGIEHPFFGVKAQTTIAPLKVAQAVDAHLLPMQVRRRDRRGGLEITFHPNMLASSSMRSASGEALLSHYNALLEDWIRQAPEDWFWLHDRWRGSKHKQSKI